MHWNKGVFLVLLYGGMSVAVAIRDNGRDPMDPTLDAAGDAVDSAMDASVVANDGFGHAPAMGDEAEAVAAQGAGHGGDSGIGAASVDQADSEEHDPWMYEQSLPVAVPEGSGDADLEFHEAMVAHRRSSGSDASLPTDPDAAPPAQGLGKTGAALLSVGGVLMAAGVTAGIFVWRHQHHQKQTNEGTMELHETREPPLSSPAQSHQGSIRAPSKPSSMRMPFPMDLPHLAPGTADNDLVMTWPDGLDFNYSMEKLFKNTRENIKTVDSDAIPATKHDDRPPPMDCKIKIDLIHKDSS
ncbi:hypothetical protein BC940DRAFT_352838 [Gongronella butleri]|nr:hypothetical protein BC940DRAFT_352838 [Gongronella butleri]